MSSLSLYPWILAQALAHNECSVNVAERRCGGIRAIGSLGSLALQPA